MNDKAEVKPDAPEGRLEALVGGCESLTPRWAPNARDDLIACGELALDGNKELGECLRFFVDKGTPFFSVDIDWASARRTGHGEAVYKLDDRLASLLAAARARNEQTNDVKKVITHE